MDNATREMESLWQAYHEQQNIYALTGSRLRDYCRYLGLGRRAFDAGIRILEIGVARGFATHEMATAGCRVDVLDICPRALETVTDCTVNRYLHCDVAKLPADEYDLAISMLVVQHMSDADIRHQFPHIYHSLKLGGRFVIQWAGSPVPGENNNPDSIVGRRDESGAVVDEISMLAGRMVRDEEYAEKLIAESGGVVVDVRGRRVWPNFQSLWFVTETARA